MAVSKAFASSGIVLYVGDSDEVDSVATWTPIADVGNVDGPEAGRNLIEVTHMTSPNNRQEFIPGQKISGKIGLTGSFAPSEPTQDPATGLMYYSDNGILRAYALVYGDERVTTFLFTGYVENTKLAASVAGKVDFSTSIQITGDFEWTTGGID